MRAYEFALPATKVSAAFETLLATRFGGFTSWPAKGAWVGPSGLEVEGTTVYRVAVPSALVYSYLDLLHFVLAFARAWGEKALYFGPPDSPTIYQTGN
jgi:hypothetical protein